MISRSSSTVSCFVSTLVELKATRRFAPELRRRGGEQDSVGGAVERAEWEKCQRFRLQQICTDPIRASSLPLRSRQCKDAFALAQEMPDNVASIPLPQ